MVEDKELAFWLVKNGWAESPQQGLRFVKAAAAGECTEEIMDSLSMKVLLEKGLEPLALDDLSQGLPEVHSDEAFGLLRKAISDGTKMLEHWHEHPTDTNARFFRVNLKKIQWDEE